METGIRPEAVDLLELLREIDLLRKTLNLYYSGLRWSIPFNLTCHFIMQFVEELRTDEVARRLSGAYGDVFTLQF